MASNAPADGHTLLVANQDIIVQPIIKAKVPYDPVKSFAPLSMLVTAPETITVHPSVPAKDVKELIALVKANPGKYSYASPGYGTTPHLAMTWLFQLENSAEITHVPFQGAAPAMQSVLGGQTPIFHMVLPVVAPHIRSGAIRPLAVAAVKRTAYFPDIPTIGEAGFAGHEVGFWMGAYAVAGTPKPVLDVLQAQIAKIMALPDIKERIATMDSIRPSARPTSWRRTCGPKPTNGRRWCGRPISRSSDDGRSSSRAPMKSVPVLIAGGGPGGADNTFTSLVSRS